MPVVARQAPLSNGFHVILEFATVARHPWRRKMTEPAATEVDASAVEAFEPEELQHVN
jgi:hypothetical protein